uniref:Uncharacterized protein n=1 Tax=viral metagenome TaxID=1070528 RepID=A0A6C0E8I4_9ZZZZ
MEKKIVNLVNTQHDLIQNPKNEIYLRIEMGKSPFNGLIKLFKCVPEFKNYLASHGKLEKTYTYYQYQYQNTWFRRYKDEKLTTENLEDHFLGSSNYNEHGIDYRFSLHQTIETSIFSQHLAFHNISFITEEIWLINGYEIINKKEKKNNIEVNTFVLNIKLPIASGQMDTINKIIDDIGLIFKNIIGNIRKNQTLDSILVF